MKIYFHNCSSEHRKQCETWIAEWTSGKSEFAVQTSGSTGVPKTILLGREQLLASATRSNAYFGINRHSRILLALSPQTIGARMLLVRALLANAEVHVVTPSAFVLASVPPDLQFDFASLVPLQLLRLKAENRLNTIRTLLLGGAPLPEDAENAIASEKHDIYYGFGMTETVSHVAIRRLGESWYQALDGVRFSEKEGKLVIHDKLLHLDRLETNDLVELKDHQQFRWLGRADFAINSGGVKIHPEMIERETGRFFRRPFLISSQPDVTFGEKVILVAEELLSGEEWQLFCTYVENTFGKYAVPKEQLAFPIPVNAAGKPDRLRIKKIVAESDKKPGI